MRAFQNESLPRYRNGALILIGRLCSLSIKFENRTDVTTNNPGFFGHDLSRWMKASLCEVYDAAVQCILCSILCAPPNHPEWEFPQKTFTVHSVFFTRQQQCHIVKETVIIIFLGISMIRIFTALNFTRSAVSLLFVIINSIPILISWSRWKKALWQEQIQHPNNNMMFLVYLSWSNIEGICLRHR